MLNEDASEVIYGFMYTFKSSVHMWLYIKFFIDLLIHVNLPIIVFLSEVQTSI